jgi:dihydrolipoamide dehydrogenase
MAEGYAYDVAILGAGPGGYIAALRAAQLGGRVVLVEKDTVGGVCLNQGCIPTKSLLASCEVLATVKQAAAYGIHTTPPRVDFGAVQRRKDQVVSRLVGGVKNLLRRAGVETLAGTGQLTGPRTLEVAAGDTVREINAASIIIATGSAPFKPPVSGTELPGVITSDEALTFSDVPQSICIIGGGAIGTEFATIFAALGSKVIIVEMLSQLVPGEDADVAAFLMKSLTRQGVTVYVDSEVETITSRDGALAVDIVAPDGRTQVVAQYVLLAAGRSPNTGGVGLDRLGVRMNKRFIAVDRRMRTSVPGIYAIGDAVGVPLLAHVASAEGVTAAENALGRQSSINYRVVPSCIFTRPEIASVGLTEKAARERFGRVKVGKFPYAASGMALVTGHVDGFVKIVGEEKYGEILGLHIIGRGAANLIGEAVLAMSLEATLDEVALAIHPHPTLTEATMEAALAGLGRAVHIHG